MAGNNSICNGAIQWGIENERYAIGCVEKITKKKVDQCGLFIHESGALAATPDGLIENDTIVEVKCPFSFRKEHEEEKILKESGLENRNGKYFMTRKSKYYDQVQMQMFVTSRKFCAFLIWTPKKSYFCNVDYDTEWNTEMPRLIDFYFTIVLPLLLQKVFPTVAVQPTTS